MEYKLVVIATVVMVILVTMDTVRADVDDYSDPIQCYYCFGPAENSSCADPVFPKEDKGQTLQPISCQNGICLKWTHYINDVLYMHRTCSHKLKAFKIMMIDGVCRTERDSKGGYLCMCGRHLCNTADNVHSINTNIMLSLATVLLTILINCGV